MLVCELQVLSFISCNAIGYSGLKSDCLFLVKLSDWLRKNVFKSKKWCDLLMSHTNESQSDCKDQQ